MTALYFDLPAALRLAEHAAAATEHDQSYTESDAGVYLMSGGIPGLRVDPGDDTSRQETVYADGWGEDEAHRHDRYRSNLGGDDFVEHLHLDDQYATRRDGTRLTLLQAMRVAAARGYRWLVIDVHNEDTFGLRMSATGPQ